MPRAKMNLNPDTEEDLIEVKFNNNESPETDVEFYFDGRWYRLLDGATYELPVSVVDHLNGLAVPVYSDVWDDKKKGYVSKITGSSNRFTCHPTKGFASFKAA